MTRIILCVPGPRWLRLARVAGAKDDAQAIDLLWSGSSYPLGSAREVYRQIKHVVRHGICFDDPFAECAPR